MQLYERGSARLCESLDIISPAQFQQAGEAQAQDWRRHGKDENPESSLFWHQKGGYGYVVAETLLRRVIQRAGLRKTLGHGGPRVHDLRHTFVVHRMTEWYRQGINPQGNLPYLAAYLGHRDIHSTLVYLTITQELLQCANERFRTAETEVLRMIQGE